MDRSWSFSSGPAHWGELDGGSSPCHPSEGSDRWLDLYTIGMKECVLVHLRCRGREPPTTVGTRRVLLVAVTKPLLCNRLGVKSQLGGPYKAWQRQGAGGWGQSAATQLWAEPTHPSSIWALLISVAARPPLPPDPRTMEAPFGWAFCRRCFQSPFRAKILNISLGLLGYALFSFATILKSIAGTSTLNPLSHGNALIGHKGTLVTVANILLVRTQQVFETEQETVVKFPTMSTWALRLH